MILAEVAPCFNTSTGIHRTPDIARKVSNETAQFYPGSDKSDDSEGLWRFSLIFL